jgi:glycosyltransferase involved in cell wall biosynthesis
VNDALAMGKPVIMTANPYIDVDLEAIGCGRTVGIGDAVGWETALSDMLQDVEGRVLMGARARAFAESEWNYELFSAALVEAVGQVGRQ